MILFIFEGAKYEPHLYDGLKSLFFPKSSNHIICSFCSSIYTFYKRLKDDYGGYEDVVNVLKTELQKTDPSNEIFSYKSADFESVYLFFDYDFFRGDLAAKNAKVQELLAYFNEETDKGKLYISYPMIESIQYSKELPDSLYHTYLVKRDKSSGDQFKKEARLFCFYNGYSFLKDETNWRHLILQNVFKANMLTTEKLSWPKDKEDVAQKPIFDAQLVKHVEPNSEVAILNAFPMFLYDYFPADKFSQEIDSNNEHDNEGV